MKRKICLILCLCLLAGFCGCSDDPLQDGGYFYYRQSEIKYASENAVIGAELRDLSGLREDPNALLAAYFAGPETSALESPFPRDTYVVAWTLEDGTLSLVMNEGFAALSGVDLSIACACISRTFLELLSVRQVVIRAVDSLLDGSASITMTQDNLLLKDDVVDRLYPTLILYYADAQQRYLIGQEISVNLADETEIIKHLLELLADQPENSDLLSAIPSGTELLDADVENGLCILNLSEEFETNCPSGSAAQRLTLLAIVNTLTQLDHIRQVEICVEGRLLAGYGLLTITGALVADESAIGPVRTALSEFDTTLYLSNGSTGCLAAVPTRIRLTTSVTQAELVLQTLLSYESINGFRRTIPHGTVINSISMRNSICYVDLSQEFLSSTDHIPTSVRSIVASLCALDAVSGVKITVNGTTPDGDYASYFGILRPASDWYL